MGIKKDHPVLPSSAQMSQLAVEAASSAINASISENGVEDGLILVRGNDLKTTTP